MKKTKLRRLLPILLTLMTIIVCALSITVIAEETEEEVRSSQITHVNIVLDNNVDVVFWADITEATAQNSDTFMTFNDGKPVSYSEMKTLGDVTYAVYRYNNVLPQDLGDVITAKLYVGNVLTSTSEYSVRSYCQYMLTSSESSDSLKTLLSDLLVYGTEAQALVGESEEQYVTNAIIGLSASSTPSNMLVIYDNVSNNDLTRGETASISQSKLLMNNDVKLSFDITLPADADASQYSVCMTVNGREQEMRVTAAGYYNNVTLDSVYVYEIFDNAEVSIYEGNVRVSNSMNFSVAAYLNALSKDAKYTDIANAFYNYGYSAHIYAGTHTVKMPGQVLKNGTSSASYDDNGSVTYVCSLCGTEIDSLTATHIRDYESECSNGSPANTVTVTLTDDNGKQTTETRTLFTVGNASETLADGSQNSYYSITRDVEENTGVGGFGYYFTYKQARTGVISSYVDSKQRFKGDSFTFSFDVKAPAEGITATTLYLQNSNVSGSGRYGRVLDINANGSIKRENGAIADEGTVNADTWTNVTVTMSFYTSDEIPYIFYEFYVNNILATSMSVVNNLTDSSFTQLYFAINANDSLENGQGIYLDNCIFAQGCVRSYTESVEEHVSKVNNNNLRKLVDMIQNDFALSDFSTVVRWDGTSTSVTTEYQSFVANPTDVYAAPLQTPSNYQHPRLLFNSSDIPSIVENMENPTNANAKAQFLSLVSTTTDGILTPTSEIAPQSFEHTNYSTSVLRAIQAKALYYALFKDDTTGNYGDALTRGYEAIYAMKNYILTFDVQWKASDQCRYYGDVMYYAALVYDWCYDLLTDDDKDQFRLGVQNLLCDGTNNQPWLSSNTHQGRKMEGGFPALFVESQSALTGHGAEAQVLRDYFSFSIAIYDEDPTWYTYVGGMIYQNYIDARNYFYSSGYFPDGSSVYNYYRYLCDLYNAWIFKGMGVEFPYNEEDMASVIHGLQSMEIYELAQFATGDGSGTSSGGQSKMTNTVGHCALISSYLFDDDVSLAIAKRLSDYKYQSNFFSEQLGISAADYLILTSNGLVANEDYAAYVDNVEYHDGYQQQVVSRNGRDEDSVAVLLQGGQHYPGGHTHHSAGSFQIWYKGMLTRDDGLYDYYGSEHHFYYHMAAVSHNTLLIYNNDMANTPIGPSGKLYYNGGQKYEMSIPVTYTAWINDDKFSYGKNIGMQTDSETDPTYVYFANNITSAYDEQTVDYVERSITTLYTGDTETPMVMFIFDNITSDSADFQKTFLLQCVEQPDIDYDNNTVTVSNGEGKMVLTSLLGADSIYAYGRTSKNGKVDPENSDGSERFYLSGAGTSVNPGGATSIGDSNSDLSVVWGHIEIQPDAIQQTNQLMNVIYVADDGTTVSATPTLIESEYMTGATFKNYTAMFVNDTMNASASQTFTVDGEGVMTYYIGGLTEGTWEIFIGGESIGEQVVTAEGRMLTFTANAGEVALVPGDDIRPDGTGIINYHLNGGKLPEGTPSYYFSYETTVLPTPTRSGATFEGWFTDAEFTEPITEIPANQTEPYQLYAKWSAPIYYVSYAEGGSLGDYGSVTHSALNGASFKIVNNDDADSYLLWTEASKNSTIGKDGAYSSYAKESLQVSFMLTIGRNGTDPVAPFTIFIRDAANKITTVKDDGTTVQSNNYLNIFKMDAVGNLYLGNSNNTKFAQLPGSGMMTVRFVLDFEAERMYAYDEDAILIADYSMDEASIASYKPFATYAEWFKKLTSTGGSLFTIKGTGSGTLRIGSIAIWSGNISDKCRNFGLYSNTHNWDDGVITREASANTCAPGTVAYTCQECGLVRNEIIESEITHGAITYSYDGANVTYSCNDCGSTYTPGTGYFLDGSGYTGIIGSGNASNYDTATASHQPKNDNGYYTLTNNTGNSGDLALWVPSIAPQLSGFDSGTKSIGFASFQINALTEDGINFHFVDTSSGAEQWSSGWYLEDSFLTVSAPTTSGGKTTVKLIGWDGMVLKEVQIKDKSTFTGWIKVMIFIELDPGTSSSADDDTITLHYYIGDGQSRDTANTYVCSVTKSLTTSTSAINSIYISGSTSKLGSGIMLDDIGFGFTSNGSWKLPVTSEE